MQRIIEYMQSTYSVGSLIFLSILGIVLVVGFFVTLILAIISSIRKHKARKTGENAEVAELYLIISHLNGKITELDEQLKESDNKTELVKERASLKAEKLEYENRLNALIGNDAEENTIDFAKEITEKKLRKKSKELQKTESEPTSAPESNQNDDRPTAVIVENDDVEVDDIVQFEPKPIESEPDREENKDAFWQIKESENNYSAALSVEGEILIETPLYSSLSGVKSAIQTIINNLLGDNCAITASGEEFAFTVFSGSGKILCKSGAYKTKYKCETALLNAKKYADSAIKKEIIS